MFVDVLLKIESHSTKEILSAFLAISLAQFIHILYYVEYMWLYEKFN